MPLVPMISQLTKLRQPFAFHACSNAALLCPDLLLRGLLEQDKQDGVVPVLVKVGAAILLADYWIAEVVALLSSSDKRRDIDGEV